MAWIESHDELLENRRVVRLAASLGCKKPGARHAAIGVLHALWWHALRTTDDGTLGDYSHAELADALRWDGPPTQLVEALVEHGWLDRAPDGALKVHAFEKYIAKLIEAKESARERMQCARRGHDPCTCKKRSAHVRGTFGARSDVPTNLPNQPTIPPNPRAPREQTEAARKAQAKRDLDAALAMANYIDPIDPTLPADPPDA